MALTYKELQDEVNRRAVRNQGGDQFYTATKNIINTSLFRIAREAYWRPLKRKDTIRTVTSYTTGSGTVTATSGSPTITLSSANFIDDGVQINRRIKIQGDSKYHYIRQVTGDTALVMDTNYQGTSSTNNTYEILPQADYNLPIQCGHQVFIWHEEYGRPLSLTYRPDQEFYGTGQNLTRKGIPIEYKMWEENMVIQPLLTPTPLAVFSSSSNDATQKVTIFGTVSDYPDSEQLTLNGTNVVIGTKIFSDVDRVTKNDNTTGRISITASGDASINYATIPAGDITNSVLYKKIQIFPLPTSAFDLNVYYYKHPYALVNDDDVHELGQEFDEAIILFSVAKIKAENSQKEAGGFLSLYADEIATLKKTNVDKIDYFPTLKSPYHNYGLGNRFGSNIGYSQFGPYYGPSRRY